MIPLATYRRDDKPNGEFYRILWEPRTGVVWLRRSFGEPRTWPTLYFAKRRFAVDVMVAEVWGRQNPKTFKPIPRGDRAVPGLRCRANSASAPDGRDGFAQPQNKKEKPQ